MGSGAGQQGHQVFHVGMPTLIPTSVSWLSFDGDSFLEGYRSQIQSSLTDLVDVSTFIANGFQAVQSVTVKNLAFTNGTDGNMIIEYDVDLVTDIDWVPVAGIITVVAGVAITLAGIFTGNPYLIFLGIVVIFATGSIFAYETIHEVVNPVNVLSGLWAFISSPVGLVLIGVTAGYFVWTASGRGFVSTSARKAAPYVKRGAKAVGGRIKGGPKGGGKSATEELTDWL